MAKKRKKRTTSILKRENPFELLWHDVDKPMTDRVKKVETQLRRIMRDLAQDAAPKRMLVAVEKIQKLSFKNRTVGLGDTATDEAICEMLSSLIRRDDCNLTPSQISLRCADLYELIHS